MPTLHPQGPRKVSTWQRARHRVRSDLGIHENRAYHVRLKPYKSHRRDVSPFPFNLGHTFTGEFGHRPYIKILALALLVLGISGGFYVWINQPSNGLFGSVDRNVDPYSTVWSPNPASNSFSRGAGASFNNNCVALAFSCETVASTTSSSAVAIAQSNVGEIGIANGKNLLLNIQFGWRNVVNCCLFSEMGWFLTTNNTVATNYASGYDPYTQDKSIVAMFNIVPTGGGNGNFNFFLNKNWGSQTIQQGDTQCDGAGACLGCACPISMGLTINHDIDTIMELNYTGTAGSGGNNGASVMLAGDVGSVSTVKFFTFPSSAFLQSSTLSVGYFMSKKSGSADTTAADFLYEPGGVGVVLFPAIEVATPIASTPSPPLPTIDTSGFFGPIIKALILVAVFMVQNVITFGTFLAGLFWPIFTAIAAGMWALLQGLASSLSAIFVAFVNVFEAIVKSLLNTVGQAFGFPTSSGCNFASNPGGCGLGDDLFQDISYLVSAITSTIATFIGGLLNIFTGILNFFTAITTWFITWGVYFLNAILAIVNLVGEIITVIKNLLLYAPSTFTWGAIVFFIIYSSLDGLQGWYSFFETFAWLILFGVSAAEKILNWLISTSVWIISQIPAFNFQVEAVGSGGGAGGKYMVGFDLPRLPLLEHNFRPSFPHNFTDPEIARFNVFSIMGLVVGTFMLIYAVGANLVPGVSAANGVNLNLINALLPVGLVMIGALGAVTLPFLLGYLFRNVFGIKISTPSVGLGLSTERISLRTGKVKGPKFKFGVRPSKHKFQVRTEDGRGKTVRGIRNILREGKRQQAASQERLRRETEHLRQHQVQAQRQREHEQRQRTERRRELGTSPEGFE